MWILAFPWLLLTLAGAGAMGYAGFLIVRGPFLGGPVLGGAELLVALGVFIVGLVAMTYGGTKTARLVVGF